MPETPLYDPLYSTSAGGKDLFSNTDPETCTKMLQKLSENLRAKFPATTHGFSMVKIARLDDVFTAEKENKRRKRKGEKNF